VERQVRQWQTRHSGNGECPTGIYSQRLERSTSSDFRLNQRFPGHGIDTSSPLERVCGCSTRQRWRCYCAGNPWVRKPVVCPWLPECLPEYRER
jgi:hypothetical protein